MLVFHDSPLSNWWSAFSLHCCIDIICDATSSCLILIPMSMHASLMVCLQTTIIIKNLLEWAQFLELPSLLGMLRNLCRLKVMKLNGWEGSYILHLNYPCAMYFQILARYSPSLLIGFEEDLVSLLKDDCDIVKEGALNILAKAGGIVREQLAALSRY